VEAGKKAAASILNLQVRVQTALSRTPQTAEEVAGGIGAADSTETIYLLLEHLAANGRARSEKANDPGETTFVRVE
jgi:glucose-6-phosphate isomerase